jgi:glutamate decarboxylase
MVQNVIPDLNPDYPLPPKEEKTEILRVVVRESMSLDLLDRLISDIIAVTQILTDSDPIDLSAFQPRSTTIEKEHGSLGSKPENENKGKVPMQGGVHRTVC